jgi:rod shape-determining protein MreC
MQLLLMSGNVNDSGGSSLLENSVLRISQPVVVLSRMIGGGFGGVMDYVKEIRTARHENVRLRSEVADLRTELDRFREDAIENERLRRLLLMKEHVAPQSVGARVVTANHSDQEHVIVVNRGTADGVELDQPVLAWGGAVGRVVFVAPGHAKVRLITDPNSGVAGIVQRSRQEGMVLGRGKGLLEMVYVPSFADVALGDRIVTSGIDGIFPRGVGIGKVHSSEPSGIARAILVQPEVDFFALEEVLVIVGSEDGEPRLPRWDAEGTP